MKKRIFVALILLLPIAAIPSIDNHLQAISVMLHVMDPQTHALMSRYRQLEVIEKDVGLEDGTRARLYTPKKIRAKHAMVVLHGVHHLGIDEPRLVAFSRSLAGQGIEVLTPELADIKDYRVTPRSIETIGAAMQHMRETGRRAGAFGLSFTGGLALLAAADPRYKDDFAFIVAVGAHDDMGRVARFFATSEVPRPDGSIQRIRAHEYGALVLVYAHPEDFFAASDLASVRACLREVLLEVTCDSATLSPSAQKTMQHVFAHDVAYFRDKLLASATRHAAEYDQVSPHGKLGGISAPVLLLHGAADDVIPPAETEWLAQEIPAHYRDEVLITPAISHVEMGGKPTAWDQFRVVNFLAQMIEHAED